MRKLITAPGIDGGPFDKEGVALINLGDNPTESEIAVEENRLVLEWESFDYGRLRKVAYDALNQDEMRYDDLINGTTTWQEAINAIKVLYPKGDV